MTTTFSKGSIVLMTLFFFGVFFLVASALLQISTTYTTSFRTEVATVTAREVAEAGLDEAAYELNQNPLYSGETNTVVPGGAFSVMITPVDSSTKQVSVTGYAPSAASPIATKTITATMMIRGDIVSFHYGVQSGNGGFALYNSSQITGNVYSGGTVIGYNNNIISGDVVSAGALGLVYGVHATGTVYAHTIGNAAAATTIDKDAYYASTITNTTVAGTKHAGSTDLPVVPLPIPDDQVTAWENQAAAGGTLPSSSCDSYSANTNTCTITSARDWGPLEIPFNLVLKNNSAVLTVSGPIWIAGNLTLQTQPTIKMDPALGSNNVAIIADNQNDRDGSGVINIGQSSQFQGSGAPNSFVFMISWNTAGEDNTTNNVCAAGSADAICMSQSSSALVAYANHGQITFSQSANAKEATAFRIVLTQSANVTYDQGLPSTVFESGPGGSWGVATGTYSLGN